MLTINYHMPRSSNLEKEVMLKLFKDFTMEYNASNISGKLNKTRIGTFKALKNLEKKGLVKGKKLGKAIFYNLDLKDEYVKKTIELLLMEEGKSKPRWLAEFKELYQHSKIIIMFGSMVRNEGKANDIDLLIVLEQRQNDALNKAINEKNHILLKKIHPIKQTKEDLIKNLKKKDKVVLNAIKEGIVLHGYNEIVELINNVTNRQ